MANLNKVFFIGRLTRDPEGRTFGNGGKVVKLGLAVNNRKKNRDTGEWEDDPVFLDLEVFNRGENGRQADLAEESLAKGHQLFVEGHLKLDQWTKDGEKRSKLVVVVDNFQFLEPKGDGPAPAKGKRGPAPLDPGGDDVPAEGYGPQGGEDEIPF